MFCRLANTSARLWQSSVNSRLLLAPASYKSTTAGTPATTDPKKDVPAEAQEQSTNYPEGIIFHAPSAPGIEKQTVETIEEVKFKGTLEDQLCVWFGKDMPTIEDDKKPERDLVNFPRFKGEEAAKVRCVIVPETWFTYFYNKTGVTGPYMFGAGFLTFLLSKELLIIEHEMVVGGSLAVIATVIVKKFKDQFNEYSEGAIDQEIKEWKDYQQGSISTLQEFIALEKQYQNALKNQSVLFDAKRENVHLQREAEYRKRVMTAYTEVKKKLDYQIASQTARKMFAQNHMVSWVIDSVEKGITSQHEKEAMSKCIADLKALALSKTAVI